MSQPIPSNRHIRRTGIVCLAMLLFAGCELRTKEIAMSDPRPQRLRMEVPDSTFKLTPEQRATIRPGCDIAALERLLGMVQPQDRAGLLTFFVVPPPGSNKVSSLLHLDDPHLQAALEEVWAPRWELLPPATVDTEPPLFPGREAAKRRRDSAYRTDKSQTSEKS